MLHFYILILGHYHLLVFRETPIFLAITTVGIGVGLGLGLFNPGLARQNIRPVGVFVAFSIFFICSYFWSVDPDTTKAAVTDYAYFAIIFLLIIFSRKALTERGVLNLFWFLSVVNFLTAVYYVVIIGGLRGGAISYNQTVFNITSLLIGASLIAMPWTIYSAFTRKSALLFAVAIGQPLFIIILSESRGGLLLFPVVLILMVMQNNLMKGRIGFQLMLGLFVAACVGIAVALMLGDLFVNNQIVDRIGQAVETYGLGYAAITDKAEDYKRLSMYLTLWEHILPTALGTGKSSFGLLNEQIFGFHVPSHSILIDLYIELGVIGTLLFGWFSLHFISRTRNAPNASLRRTMATSLIVAFAYGSLQGIFYNLTFYFALAVVFTLTASSLQRPLKV